MITPRTKLPDLDDTIVALSSARGPAARGIVRMSGRRAASIVASVCAGFDKDQLAPRRCFRGDLRLPEFAGPIAADIYFFAAPRTYTGQDVIEIHVISCQPILDALIGQCLNAGARAAQPGEFTMRAFLAGKLDLTRAEAVLGVIEATDRQELQHALTQLAGGIAQPLRNLREDLLDLLADVEAGLDFADEDIHFIKSDDLLKRLAYALAHLTNLKKQLNQRAIGQRAFRVVLAGRPNAGKSSLFNALVGKNAALVDAEPGTTRDYLQATIKVDDVSIELVDTAGQGEATCHIDAAAQNLGQEQSQDADLVLWCVPAEEQTDFETSLRHLLVATKNDRGAAAPGVLATSAWTGVGIAELRARLLEESRRAGHAALAPSISRCGHHVEACIQHLQNAHALVVDEGMPELLALHVRLALEELGALVGVVYTDDLLDRLFRRFCIGK